jgi:hypothetical protein
MPQRHYRSRPGRPEALGYGNGKHRPGAITPDREVPTTLINTANITGNLLKTGNSPDNLRLYHLFIFYFFFQLESAVLINYTSELMNGTEKEPACHLI